MDGWIDGWMGWMDGMNGWIDRMGGRDSWLVGW